MLPRSPIYLEPVVTDADPKAKVLPRLLIEELCVICRAEILPTSRLVTHRGLRNVSYGPAWDRTRDQPIMSRLL